MSDNAGRTDDDRDPEALYANHFEIRHNALEFLLDFCQVSPTSQRVTCHTRIITHPLYAKALLQTLAESIGAYERAYGQIGEED